MKRLLIIAFVFYSTSLSFASSSETLFLQCPLVVNKLVEKVKAQPGSDFEKYGTKGTISEMRFFKLKIKKFDAHLTIHSAFIYNVLCMMYSVLSSVYYLFFYHMLSFD